MKQVNLMFAIMCACIIASKPIYSLDISFEVNPSNVQRVGETVLFTCSTPNSNSTIVLRRNGERMAITSEKQEGNRRIYTVSRKIEETDNFAVFKCSERFENDPGKKNERQVESPLKIPTTAKIQPPYRIISSGDDAIFTCEGEAVPAVSYYNWWVNKNNIEVLPADRFIQEDGGRTLRIRNVTEDLNQSDIKCRVGNVLVDKRSKANAKSYLFLTGMPMNMTMPPTVTNGYSTISPTGMPMNMTMPPTVTNGYSTVSPSSQTDNVLKNSYLDLKMYFIIGAAGVLTFSIVFVCSLCIMKMKRNHREERKKSVCKDAGGSDATDKFDEVERARPNSYSELPGVSGKTIEPVMPWKIVTMDTFRGDEDPDFGPQQIYPNLDDEDIYENMDSMGNAKEPTKISTDRNSNGYAAMTNIQPTLYANHNEFNMHSN